MRPCRHMQTHVLSHAWTEAGTCSLHPHVAALLVDALHVGYSAPRSPFCRSYGTIHGDLPPGPLMPIWDAVESAALAAAPQEAACHHTRWQQGALWPVQKGPGDGGGARRADRRGGPAAAAQLSCWCSCQLSGEIEPGRQHAASLHLFGSCPRTLHLITWRPECQERGGSMPLAFTLSCVVPTSAPVSLYESCLGRLQVHLLAVAWRNVAWLHRHCDHLHWPALRIKTYKGAPSECE